MTPIKKQSLHHLLSLLFVSILWLFCTAPTPVLAQDLFEIAAEDGLEETAELSAFEDLLLNISQTQMIWKFHTHTYGPNTFQFDIGELDQILQKAASFKEESLIKLNGPFRDEVRAEAFEEYTQVYLQLLFLVLSIAPERAQEVNESMAFDLSTSNSSLLNGFKVQALIDEDPIFLIENSTFKNSKRIRLNDSHIDSTRAQTELLDPSLSQEAILLQVSKNLILALLNQSIADIKELLGEKEPTPQNVEFEFRTRFSQVLASEVVPVEEFTPSHVQEEWTQNLLKVILPDEEFDSEGIESLTTYLRDGSSVLAKDHFVDEVLQLPHRLSDLSLESFHALLCEQWPSSVQAGLQETVFNLEETTGKENAVKEFLADTMTTPPCPFLEASESPWVQADADHPKSTNLDTFTSQMNQTIEEGTDVQAFLKREIDIASAIKYFKYQMIVDGHTVSIAFSNWLDSIEEGTVESLKASLMTFTDKAKNDSNYEGSSLLLQGMADRAKNSLEAIEEFRSFFKLTSETIPVTNQDLTGGEEESSQGLMRFWFLDQQIKWPILTFSDENHQRLTDLWTKNQESNKRLIRQFLQRTLQTAKDSVAMVSEWSSLDEIEKTLTHSKVLQQALRLDPSFQSPLNQFLEKSQAPNKTEDTVKALYHKYVFTGFTGLIALQLSRFIVKFKYPQIAAYITQALGGIPKQALNKFMISAMALIGVDLAYETHRIFIKEQPRHDEYAQIYHSSYQTETSLIQLLDYEKVVSDLRTEKTGYFVRLTLDTVLLGLPLSLTIPALQRSAGRIFQRLMLRKARRLDGRITRASEKMGLPLQPPRFEKQFVDDFYQTQKRSLQNRLDSTFREIRTQSRVSFGTARNIKNPKPAQIEKLLIEQNVNIQAPKMAALLQRYTSAYQALVDLEAGYSTLISILHRNSKLWQRFAIEMKFEFEKLGVEPGHWNWHDLGAAYQEARSLYVDGKIAKAQFDEIEVAYMKIMQFLFRKSRLFTGTDNLRAIFSQSLQGSQTHRYNFAPEFVEMSRFQKEFGYEVISLKNKDTGEPYDLIVPKVQRAGLGQ